MTCGTTSGPQASWRTLRSQNQSRAAGYAEYRSGSGAGLVVVGINTAAFDGRCIPSRQRCPARKYAWYSRFWRLAGRVPRPSRCVTVFMPTTTKPQCCIKKMKKISQIVKSVWFKAAFSLVSGSHQWCDPGSVRFFSIFFTLRESLRRPTFVLSRDRSSSLRLHPC